MPPKKFKLGQERGYIGEKKSIYKPKPYNESEVLTEYRLHRNICYYIQHGGECEWSEEEVDMVRGIYFKTLF